MDVVRRRYSLLNTISSSSHAFRDSSTDSRRIARVVRDALHRVAVVAILYTSAIKGR